MKVIEFSGRYVDGSINDWLQGNPNVKVVDIKYSISVAQMGSKTSGALILYEDDSSTGTD